MRGRPAEELLRLPVRLHGIQLGRPVDLILDLVGERALGLDVLCGDDVHRFLPLAAATVGDDEITVRSALTLLEEAELAFYRSRASELSALRGAELVHAFGHGGVCVSRGGAYHARRFHAQNGPQPFAPGENTVPHGLMN